MVLSELTAIDALEEVLARIGTPRGGVEALGDSDLIPHLSDFCGAELKRWHRALRDALDGLGGE